MMHFFCLITPRDWFINLCDRILRAGEQALDHLWPCGKCVSLLTRKFVTSLGKCLLFEVGGCGTKNEPRSLALPVSFFFFFFFFSRSKTYFVAGKETPAQKCWYWRPTRKLLAINQPIRRRTKLKSRLNYSCFQVSNRGVYFQLS